MGKPGSTNFIFQEQHACPLHCIGDVGQGCDVHMAKAFLEEPHFFESDVGKWEVNAVAM